MTRHALAQSLELTPESIFLLTPRQFEELVADLLSSQGWNVELTPPTRDGGVDIRASLTTGVSSVLCLVQVKKYRKDRAVGINSVRELYGVMEDHNASQAMIVTTSSFSREARAFAQRHQHQIFLHAYDALAKWIQLRCRRR